MNQDDLNPFDFNCQQLYELLQPWPGYASICPTFWSDPEVMRFFVPYLVAAVNAALLEYNWLIEADLAAQKEISRKNCP